MGKKLNDTLNDCHNKKKHIFADTIAIRYYNLNNSGRGLILCLHHGFAFSLRLEILCRHLMQRHAERSLYDIKAPRELQTADALRAFESLLQYFDVRCWLSALCCSKLNTHFALWWNYKVLHLLGKIKWWNKILILSRGVNLHWSYGLVRLRLSCHRFNSISRCITVNWRCTASSIFLVFDYHDLNIAR